MTTPLPSWPPRRTDRSVRRGAARAGRPRPYGTAVGTAPRPGHDRRRRRSRPGHRPVRHPQNSRFEDLALDERSPAELGEWERIVQLLADAPPGTVYDPDTDDVVRAELAADAAAAAAREAELREAMRIAARADELQALRELGTLDQAKPRTGDEAVRDELTRRAGGYVQADVDAWLARALATHLGHYRDPAAREAAAGLLTPPVLAHAALLAELLRLVPGVDVGQLAFATRLATTEPEAAGDLAAFLARARPER
ncbi:hypothetical protein [Streptomyces microflavus]|uniref:hypothetical protein n=1 Tax=Streptomyces microflavus TaxID=1919 RepID=UPI00364F192A